jgi:hypothetical protein
VWEPERDLWAEVWVEVWAEVWVEVWVGKFLLLRHHSRE